MEIGDPDAATESKIQIKWKKFRQLVPLLTNKDISLTVRVKLYSRYVRSSMLHGSETWPAKKKMRRHFSGQICVRCMCGIKVKDRVTIKDLIKRLGLDDIISILQQNRLRCYGHVL